ncbi:nuclear pore complex protein NUP214 isoform X2 [Senna tora]|uniref:Nuclear pore complex protein NUP214 isoform X2 n=1 Tax=Senna tora TaxID=362788 RepID=A0A834X3G6_9FABA|nr:nuclear pore complex protein NUP214 isoform X2 [Senna tora]
MHCTCSPSQVRHRRRYGSRRRSPAGSPPSVTLAGSLPGLRGRDFLCFDCFFVSRLCSLIEAYDGARGHWTATQRRVRWVPGDGEDAFSSVSSSSLFLASVRSKVLTEAYAGGGSGLRMPAGSLVPSLASEYQQDGDVHKAIGDGEGSKNIRAVHGVKEKEQGNKPTFKRTLRIFVEDGGKRRVQWELERQATEEPPKKGVPLTTVEQISTQVKQDGRLLCWVPRAQSQVHQGSSVQETKVMKRDVGVQTEEYEIVVLGDVRGVELAGMGEKGTKVGEGVPRSAPCKGKAKMDAQDNIIVTLRDPSTSGRTKCLEPETDSSSSEAEEGEFLDEASIISFFDNEEGLLIEQLEKEYEDQERDQKRRLDDGLEGVASLLEMDGGEGDIRPSFFPMASIDGEVAFCKDKGTEHVSVNLLSDCFSEFENTTSNSVEIALSGLSLKQIIPVNSIIFVHIIDQLAINANKKNTDQHIVLLGWSVDDDKSEAVIVDIERDNWVPRIELQDRVMLCNEYASLSCETPLKKPRVDQETKKQKNSILLSLSCFMLYVRNVIDLQSLNNTQRKGKEDVGGSGPGKNELRVYSRKRIELA